MAKKVLVVNYEKCSGCRMCEVVCSWRHQQEFNPAKSAIQIVTLRDKSVDIPIICQQCDKAMCQQVCQPKAISYNSEYFAYIVDEQKCIGCKMCISACPVGAMNFDPDKGVAIKCDLCKGVPQCVRYCPMGALEYIDADKISIKKKYVVAEKFFTEILSAKSLHQVG